MATKPKVEPEPEPELATITVPNALKIDTYTFRNTVSAALKNVQFDLIIKEFSVVMRPKPEEVEEEDE